MDSLPFLISIPHGGTEIPEEVTELVRIGPAEMREDIDHFTREVFGIDAYVGLTLEAHVSRTIVDLNRDPSLLPPENKDGVVKTHTCLNEPIYRKLPGPEVVERMLKRYYWPYHQSLKAAADSGDYALALDCHSMAAVGPDLSPDPGRPRPLVCLGNRKGESAPHEWLELLAQAFRQEMELPEHEVVLNKPYPGGYISRFYGNNPTPFIQIEYSRALYVEEPPRFEFWRQKFHQVLLRFWQGLETRI